MKRIVIIDDDPIFGLMLKKNFENTGKTESVTVFSNGQDAFIFLIDNFDVPELLPDFVFVDLNMPLWDGWEFIRSVNTLSLKFSKKIKFYVLSSFFQDDDMDKVKELKGIDGFLAKPGSLFDLKDLINKFMD